MRYAEVLLIYAEAVNENGTVRSISKFDAINKVCQRAGLADFTALSVDGFRDAVRLERRLELASEEKRMYDLLKYGTLIETFRERSDNRDLGHNIPDTNTITNYSKSNRSKLRSNPKRYISVDVILVFYRNK